MLQICVIGERERGKDFLLHVFDIALSNSSWKNSFLLLVLVVVVFGRF